MLSSQQGPQPRGPHSSFSSRPILLGTAWGPYGRDPSWDSWEGLCHCHSWPLADEESPRLEGGHKEQRLTRSSGLRGWWN